MSHYVNSGASTFRPWHYAETRDVWGTLTGKESGKEVQRLAGLDYLMRKVPLQTVGGLPLSRAYGILRNNGTLVGNEASGHPTVGEDLELFQPEEMFGFCDALREVSDDVRYLSAGTLKGGRVMWVLADAGRLMNLRRPNGVTREHRKGLFVYNPCDGTGKLRTLFTDIDVCCWNTASAALRSDTPLSWSTKHTVNMRDRLKDAAEALELASIGFAEQREVWEILGELRMSSQDMAEFAAQVATEFDEADVALETLRRTAIHRGKNRGATLMHKKAADLHELFSRGIGAAGVDGVDALSAVTEYIDHQRGRSAKWRQRATDLGVGMDSALYGAGAAVKRRAVRLLMTRAGRVEKA